MAERHNCLLCARYIYSKEKALALRRAVAGLGVGVGTEALHGTTT